MANRSRSTATAEVIAPQSAGSPRQRLLEVADALFYGEGVHVVGIDRILKEAGAAKASLYHHFGGKDGLVRAYLEEHFELRREQIEQVLAGYTNPKEQLLALFAAVETALQDPAFRGCRFINASTEARPGESVEVVTGEYRKFLRTLFSDLAKRAGASNPEQLGRQLALVYDGAAVAARLDTDRSGAGDAARSAAIALVDAATRHAARPGPNDRSSSSHPLHQR
ncbi:MAG: TetR-family transcriptional regulator [Acidimicrobiaceae bacterium]|jgi:AcrR family transcriptional regulator|nr:TetR-family transcriptional regulator [Acidimicrobiaceae bacterium]